MFGLSHQIRSRPQGLVRAATELFLARTPLELFFSPLVLRETGLVLRETGRLAGARCA